jgi:hypothetical protein
MFCQNSYTIYIYLGKKVAKKCGLLLKFSKTLLYVSKHSPIGRKIAQSGHPEVKEATRQPESDRRVILPHVGTCAT